MKSLLFAISLIFLGCPERDSGTGTDPEPFGALDFDFSDTLSCKKDANGVILECPDPEPPKRKYD